MRGLALQVERDQLSIVMAGLVPDIHAFLATTTKMWMPGT